MQTEQININGMTCGGCTSKITRALQAVGGVGDVKVSLSSGEATIQYDERVTSPAQLKSAVTAAGYGVDPTPAKAARPAKGGCCG